MAPDLVPVAAVGPERARLALEAARGHAVGQVLSVLFKWRWLVFGLLLAFTAAAGIAMYLKPKVHMAAAKVLLKGDRVSLQISGLSSFSGKLGYPPQVMQSEIELMRSRVVLLPVAQRLLAGDGGSQDGAAEALEATVRKLQNSLAPVALPDTNVVRALYFAAKPGEAERTLGLILEQYLEQQMVAHGGSGRVVAFYRQEKDRVEADFRTAEEQVARWKQANNVVSIDEQITRELGLLTSLETTAHETETQIESARSRITTLSQQLSGQPTHLVTSREKIINPLLTKVKAQLADAEVAMRDIDGDPLVTKLKAELVTAEVALNDLLQRYTERDRRVLEKREQIAELERKLTTARGEAERAARGRVDQFRRQLALAEQEAQLIGAETTALNPLRETLEKELGAAQALLSSLLSQKRTVDRQVRETAVSLAVLREKKHEVERLARVQSTRADALKLAEQKLREAELAAGLDKEQLANVAVIEQPHRVPYSDRGRRVGIVALAALVGLALGLAIAFGSEFFGDSLRTRDDVEYYIGLPVLASIPELKGRRLALEA